MFWGKLNPNTPPDWFSVWLLCCVSLPAVLSIHILQVTAVLPPGGLRWKLEWCCPSKSGPLTFTPASLSRSQREIPVMHRARGTNKRCCRWRLLVVGEAEVLSNVATVLSLKTASCGGHREADCLGLYTCDLCAALPSFSRPTGYSFSWKKKTLRTWKRPSA